MYNAVLLLHFPALVNISRILLDRLPFLKVFIFSSFLYSLKISHGLKIRDKVNCNTDYEK